MLQIRAESVQANPVRGTTAKNPPDCYAARRHALYDWAMHRLRHCALTTSSRVALVVARTSCLALPHDPSSGKRADCTDGDCDVEDLVPPFKARSIALSAIGANETNYERDECSCCAGKDGGEGDSGAAL